MPILGISAFYHDSAAAIIRDGEIVAAAREEQFTRVKHDSELPENALRHCLDAAGRTGLDVDPVVFYEKPFLKFERLLEAELFGAPARKPEEGLEQRHMDLETSVQAAEEGALRLARAALAPDYKNAFELS